MPKGEICWICGANIPESFKSMDVQSGRFCLQCQRKHAKEYRETVDEYLKLKSQVMFERAMRMMEHGGADMTKYKRYALAVQKHQADNPDLYKSTHEIIAAVVMLEQDYDFEMNYKIGEFVVDMYIPDLHIIVEIDGYLHDWNKLKDSNRDVKLRQMLGAEWEVVRIPTKYIEQNPPAIPKAVLTLAADKRRIRKENCGFIPASYSKRDAAHYKSAMLYETIKAPR